MSQIKRSSYFLVVFEDERIVDLAAFLRGRIESAYQPRASAISAVTETTHRLLPHEIRLLQLVPAHDWSDKSQLAAEHEIPEEDFDGLVDKGLLISDADDPECRRLRQREEAFADSQWHPCAAFYNLMIKRPGGLAKDQHEMLQIASVAARSQQATDEFVAKHGPPPPPFHEVPAIGEPVRLPLIRKQGGLYRALAHRKTVRAFDTGTPLPVEDLAAALYYVFGCHGHTKLTKGVPLLHKTSPSGGSLHPIEVYPLVLNVSGLATGIYHYRVRDHMLTPIRKLERWEAEEMAVGMSAGHDFAAAAHVVLLMTARWPRNFWKYRRSVKTHSVILMDAGHLSQTLYLVCTDLGLGVFYVAFDAYYIGEALALDGIREGAVGLAGLGIPISDGIDYSLDFAPYTPGETEI